MEDFIPLQLVSTRAEKLLGTLEEPGVLLSGLTKQTIGRAPINRFIFVDEAEAINDPGLIGSFKSIFEPANGIFPSPYLNGTEVQIAENLIFFAINIDEIKDPAFAQRMAFVKFPRFKKSYLRKCLFDKMMEKLVSQRSHRSS